MRSPELDHVAFVVPDIETAAAEFLALGLEPDEARDFAAEGTREQYLGPAQATGRILLMQPLGSEGPYAHALQERGAGLHHVALTVEDLDAFLTESVAGSGWLLHPLSFRTRQASNTIWLTRPNVEVLVEVHQGAIAHGEPVIDELVIAGLEMRESLGAIFADCGVEVVAGAGSGVRIAEKTITMPGGGIGEVDSVFEHNREAWNGYVRAENRWTVPASAEEVARARDGVVEVLLTPTKFVPPEWLGELAGRDLLCLASGGGQQGPLFAAGGANVTVLDASDSQLEREREVAEREDLRIERVHGDMRDLSAFEDESFDLIFHACSNSFVEEIAPVWHEAYRVLRPGGELLAGFSNAVMHCFDWGSIERGTPRLRFTLPYRDIDHLDVPWVARMVANGEALEFGHTLEQQIGGQLAAGFQLIDMFEDTWGGNLFPDPYFAGFIATRARKQPDGGR